MNVLRVTLNGVVLRLITLASVIVGFAAYRIIGPSNQLAVQVPVAITLLCTPVIFIHTHYVTQGYMTAASNIVAIWIFQAPVNIVGLSSRATAPSVHSSPNNRRSV